MSEARFRPIWARAGPTFEEFTPHAWGAGGRRFKSCCETLGARPPVAIREEYEHTVSEARAAMGEVAFPAAWAEGWAMSLDQALDEALGQE